MESSEITVANYLLDIQAVLLRPNEPFTWASGWKSPIYCDNRKLLSYPDKRRGICQFMVDIIKKNFKDVEYIAGVATGAIAYGIMVAEALDKPFVYVRPKAKDHGTGARIEGVLPKGAKVVVIEDLISTGMSSLSAANCLAMEGATVEGMVAIFSYGFPRSIKDFENSHVELHTLTNYDTLIEQAVKNNYVKPEDLDVLRDWRFKPDTWGQK